MSLPQLALRAPELGGSCQQKTSRWQDVRSILADNRLILNIVLADIPLLIHFFLSCFFSSWQTHTEAKMREQLLLFRTLHSPKTSHFNKQRKVITPPFAWISTNGDRVTASESGDPPVRESACSVQSKENSKRKLRPSYSYIHVGCGTQAVTSLRQPRHQRECMMCPHPTSLFPKPYCLTMRQLRLLVALTWEFSSW